MLERKLSVGIAARAYRSMEAIEVGVWKSLCWREAFGGYGSRELYK